MFPFVDLFFFRKTMMLIVQVVKLKEIQEILGDISRSKNKYHKAKFIYSLLFCNNIPNNHLSSTQTRKNMGVYSFERAK